MSLKGKNIGIAITGSFCTYEKTFTQMESLVRQGASVRTIFSNSAASLDSRFGSSDKFLKLATDITGYPPILTIPDAEPIGPGKMFDILVLLPCTGNTIAKLANGITDTPALMAAKAHLRNNRPLLISLSTNDALGMNMKNIGILMNTKHIFFIPFAQDNPGKKPNSMISRIELLIPSIEAALEGRQIQPVIGGAPCVE